MGTIQDNFPQTGFTTAKQNAAFLGIGLSTWWLWVRKGKAPAGHKFAYRTTRWKAEDVRALAHNLAGEDAE